MNTKLSIFKRLTHLIVILTTVFRAAVMSLQKRYSRAMTVSFRLPIMSFSWDLYSNMGTPDLFSCIFIQIFDQANLSKDIHRSSHYFVSKKCY